MIVTHLISDGLTYTTECCRKHVDDLPDQDWVVMAWKDGDTPLCVDRKEDPEIVAIDYSVDVQSKLTTTQQPLQEQTEVSPSPLDLQTRPKVSEAAATAPVDTEPKYFVEDITPDQAIEYLGYNTHNRSLRFRAVAAYTADMKNGKWQPGVGSIKIATDGTVIDGQHRLHAIVNSETTQRMFVVTNLPMSVQDVVDAGAKRTFADVLKLRGETRWNILASITRRAEIFALGQRALKGNVQPTNSQLLQRLEANPELRYSTEVADYVRTKIPISASILGLTHWLFGKIETSSEEEAEQLKKDVATFFQQLRDGTELVKEHPIYVLRRTANENKNSTRIRLPEDVLIAYVIKAWNAYREGRTITLLRYRPGGANPEKFPEPV